MTSAFGGQRSIQLSYGCLVTAIQAHRTCRNAKSALLRVFISDRFRQLREQLVAQLQRIDQGVDFGLSVIHGKGRTAGGC